MLLRIVSRPGPTAPVEGSLTVAASVPAFVSLEGSDVRRVTTSGLLTGADYREVWALSLREAWRILQDSRATVVADEPDLILLHTYSLYLLFAQILVFDRFLDRCHTMYGIQRIEVESPDDFGAGREVFYPPALYSPYFHEVAEAWACARGVSCVRLPGGTAGSGEKTHRSKLSTPEPKRDPRAIQLNRRSMVTRLVRRIVAEIRRIGSLGRTSWYLLTGGRSLIFYLPSPATGLHLYGPRDSVNVEPLLPLLRRLGRAKEARLPREAVAVLERHLPLADPRLTRYTDLISRRFFRHLEQTLQEGQAIYGGTRRLVQILGSRGFKLAFVGPSPLIDFQRGAYAADAVQRLGYSVGSVQHGGNYRLYRIAGTPHLLTDFLGGTFFQWGAGNMDEHTTSGISFACRFVRTGSPRTRELQGLAPKRMRRHRRARLRILYAPTVPSIMTSYGAQMAWDSYIPVVREICDMLNESGHECLVKVLPTPEVRALGLESYTNLTLLTSGGFIDYMWDTDYLIIDSLGGSPIYEAISTDLPILLYTGIPHQIWDEDFIAELRRRVVCFDTEEGYLNGVRSFVREPEQYVRGAGVLATTTLRDRYFPAATSDDLWRHIRNTMFGAGIPASFPK